MIGASNPKVSIIFTAFKSRGNIPALIEALEAFAKARLGILRIQAVFVVDGCPIGSVDALKSSLSCPTTFEWKVIELTRNCGAPFAQRSGLESADGDFFTGYACDLQEPFTFIDDALKAIETKNVEIVFGQRRERKDPLNVKLFSAMFWTFYSKFISPDIPRGDLDLFFCTRFTRDTLMRLKEDNQFIIGLLLWIGFPHAIVSYDRAQRMIGKSSWILRKRVNYLLDSVYSFSDLPLKLIIFHRDYGVLYFGYFWDHAHHRQMAERHQHPRLCGDIGHDLLFRRLAG
jgi:glycosyltransferase involved in cell wall biosynthesis